MNLAGNQIISAVILKGNEGIKVTRILVALVFTLLEFNYSIEFIPRDKLRFL